MAGTIRFTDGVDTIDVSPILGFRNPFARRESVNITLSGKSKVHKWSQKNLPEIPLTNVSLSDRDQFFTWWNAKTELTITLDLDAFPAVTITGKLMNPGFPLQQWNAKEFDTFAGSLVVREV